MSQSHGPSTRRRITSMFVLSAGLGVMLAGCGGEAPPESGSDNADSDTLSVGLVVTGAFGDRSYFDAAAEAIPDLEEAYNAEVSTYEAKLEAQNYAPLLQDAADANELVYVLGNQAVDATAKAAADNPDTTFVFVNGFVPSPDVVSVTFRYEEACYVGGTVAALVNGDEGKDTIGFIGGFETPPISACEAGFEQGATAVNPDLKMVSQLVGSFSDPNKGFEVAQAQAQAGAYSLYCIAGLSCQGVAEAAASGAAIAPIHAAFPQVPAESPAVLNDFTSVLLLDVAKNYDEDTLTKGQPLTFGFKEDAFEASYNSDILSAEQQQQVDAVIEDIAAGVIKPEGV